MADDVLVPYVAKTSETELVLDNVTSAMADDVLVPYVAKTSTTMILIVHGKRCHGVHEECQQPVSVITRQIWGIS